MVIDPHLHVWDLARAEYGWLGPSLPEVYRDIRVAEIAPTLQESGVTGVVLVQSADNIDDTRNMLREADDSPLVLGIVGWVPVEDPDAAAPLLDELARDSRIVGIRNLIHDRNDPDWVLRPAFRAGLALLEERGLSFDFVTSGPAALSRLAEIASERTGMRFVLDHLGKPPINGTDEAFRDWEAGLRRVADLPNVVAKASGLYSSVGPEDSWTPAGVRRVLDVAVDVFGPNRLMYAGDWPMSLRAGGYIRVREGLRQAVADWPAAALDRFWWQTAQETYGLTLPS